MKGKRVALLLLAAIIGLTPMAAIAEGLGVNSHVVFGYNYIDSTDAIQDAGIRWVRDYCAWDSVETQRGKFAVPANIKNYYKMAKESGAKTIMILCYGNDAYTLSNGTTADPHRTMPSATETEYMEGWKQYVRTIAEEMGDYIDAYEVWNEPDGFNDLITDNYVSTYRKAAKAYAECYMGAREVLDEVQPGKPVIFGALYHEGSTASDGVPHIFYDAMATEAQNNGTTFSALIQDVSFHFYLRSRADMASILSNWETLLDEFGFTGKVWLTETGFSEYEKDNTTYLGQTAQAEYLPKAALEWDRYLFANGREGTGFWFSLQNRTGTSNYESSFGLVLPDFTRKPSFYAMKARNKAVNYMPMTAYSTPLIAQDKVFNIVQKNYYGMLGTYSDGINTTYVGYHQDDKGGNVTVNLSGTKAYVYDYMGNVITTLNPQTTSTYSMPISETVTYVACVNPRTYINNIYYDETHNVIALSGEVSELDNADLVGIVLKDSGNSTVFSDAVPIKNGRFNAEIPASAEGTYTVTVGSELTQYYASAEVVVEQPEQVTTAATLGNATVSISGNAVTVTGSVTDASDGDAVSIIVVPSQTNLGNLKKENIAYADDVVISNGTYSFTFTMPEKSEGTYKVLLSGANISNPSVKDSVAYGTESGFINVCDFQYGFQGNEIVSSEEEVWSEDFESSPATTGTNQTVATIAGTHALYGNPAYTLGGVALPTPIVFGTGDVYKLAYDIRRADGVGNGEASVMLSIATTPNNNAYRFGIDGNTLLGISWGAKGASSGLTISPATWYHCEIMMDYDAQTITYTVYNDSTAIYTTSTDWFEGFTQLASVGVYFPGGNGIYLDNIVLSEVSREEVTNINVSGALNNPSAISKTCTIIIAQYTQSGALAGISYETVNVGENIVQAIQKVTRTPIAENAVTAKAFIFDDFEGLRPLVNGLSIPLP